MANNEENLEKTYREFLEEDIISTYQNRNFSVVEPYQC